MAENGETALLQEDLTTKMTRIPADSYVHGSLAGCLLVASPSLTDSIFSRSVCLVVEHSPQGAAGVVLNRPINSEVGPLWKELVAGSINTAEPPRHLHFGGPVSGPVVAVHDQESLADAGNGAGVYIAAQAETLKKLVFVSSSHYRLMVGHAAWSEGQLESEIIKGQWHVLPASPDLVFTEDDQMWHQSIKGVGAMVFQQVTGLAPVPSSLLN